MSELDISKETNSGITELTFREKIFTEPYLIKTSEEVVGIVDKEIKIRFTLCKFYENVFYQINQEIYRARKISISFDNCVIQGSVRALETRIKRSGKKDIEIFFSYCLFQDITFWNLSITRIAIINSIIYSTYQFSIKDCKIAYIKILNVLGGIAVSNTKEANIQIQYSDDNLYLPTPKISKLLKDIVKKGESLFDFETKIRISKPKSLNVEFKKSKEEGFDKTYLGRRYVLTKKQFDSLNISLDVQMSKEISQKIELNRALLNSLTLRGLSIASIEITRSRINRVFMRSLSFKSLKIYDLSSRVLEKSVFESRKIDFSNSIFDKVDLKSYSIVSFYQSTLNDINFISPKFPKEIHVLENIWFPENKEEGYFRMQSENYRQIKKSLVTSDNQPEALEMHSKMHSSLIHDKQLGLQDRIILYLNKCSNMHGTSILRPFIIMIVSAILLFYWYRSSLPEAPFVWGFYNAKSMLEAIAGNFIFVFDDFRALWLLINPTHKLTTLESLEPDSELGTWPLFISYFSRIIMAWIIYQFVMSFRKFGRKL